MHYSVFQGQLYFFTRSYLANRLRLHANVEQAVNRKPDYRWADLYGRKKIREKTFKNRQPNRFSRLLPCLYIYIYTQAFSSIYIYTYRESYIHTYNMSKYIPNISIHIYIYPHIPTHIQMYPNASTHRKYSHMYSTIPKCIQPYPNAPKHRKHTQTYQTTSKDTQAQKHPITSKIYT